ncbi:hypothetical protein P43SY_003886 [Pythium insidiosum]|uniref:BZIP domain-containing protein n=1 Tax=Pythium insidiosum TaxID=114742 RepID=A0AAD5LBG5_PYTIN|nr:hypothetical protein P43SY_003886 [Pythium insidiosum]
MFSQSSNPPPVHATANAARFRGARAAAMTVPTTADAASPAFFNDVFSSSAALPPSPTSKSRVAPLDQAPFLVDDHGFHSHSLPADELVKSLQPVPTTAGANPARRSTPNAMAMMESRTAGAGGGKPWERAPTGANDAAWAVSDTLGYRRMADAARSPMRGVRGASQQEENGYAMPPNKYRRMDDEIRDQQRRYFMAQRPNSARTRQEYLDEDADTYDRSQHTRMQYTYAQEELLRERQRQYMYESSPDGMMASPDHYSARWGVTPGREAEFSPARRIHRELQPPRSAGSAAHAMAMATLWRGHVSEAEFSPGSRIVTPAAALHNNEIGQRMARSQALVEHAMNLVAPGNSPFLRDDARRRTPQTTPPSSSATAGSRRQGESEGAASRHPPLERKTPQSVSATAAIPRSSSSRRQAGTSKASTRSQQPAAPATSPPTPPPKMAPTPAKSTVADASAGVTSSGEPKRRCGRKSMNYSSEQKRERNRAAVKKCRQRQALKYDYLRRKAEVLASENHALSEMLVKSVELDEEKRVSLTRGIQMDILLKIKEIFTQSLPKDFVLDADSIWDLNSVLAVSMPARCYYGIESIKDFWRTSLRMRNKGKIRSFWAWLFRLPPGDRFLSFSIKPFAMDSNLYFINWTTKSTPPLSGAIVIMFGHGHRVTLHVEVFGWLIWRYLLTNTPFPEPAME